MELRNVSIPQRLKSKPLVLANCIADDSSLVSYVPDDETGQYRALHYAFSQGYRRPLFINHWESAAILERPMIDGRPQFDILICGNDRIAFCAYQLLLGRGLKIPGDVAVLVTTT
ncbi:Sucrose specific transcriptional regulator CscR [Pseudomonas amygdali pv. morsprunorum]|nr:Sucrose specific transcriptional regulator CscR [Pseudomonas amygdali pv. morsprunorum]RMO98078.1 Sucrose specific transcriptional regulator CscR [Pseudomonas amygdali pv. morsprunorum]RMU34722.1 Sucrose specific transcriptional regulator CscR [Pseudomonas amygdali pv. morsprunorum]